MTHGSSSCLGQVGVSWLYGPDMAATLGWPVQKPLPSESVEGRSHCLGPWVGGVSWELCRQEG